jgi:hypothetical protein
MRYLVALSALALAAGCSDEGPSPEPGAVTFALVASGTAPVEGGAVFLLPGDTLATATVDDGMIFLRSVPEGTRVVIVRGTPGAIRFRVDVEDVHRPPDVRIEQVSGPDDRLRSDLSAYRLEVQQ